MLMVNMLDLILSRYVYEGRSHNRPLGLKLSKINGNAAPPMQPIGKVTAAF